MIALAENVDAVTPICCLTRAHGHLTFNSGQCTALRSLQGNKMLASAIFYFRTCTSLTSRQIEQEIVRKARHLLQRAAMAA